MLKTIPLHNSKTLCAVKVPEGATHIQINSIYLCYVDPTQYDFYKRILLPNEGNWRILALDNELNDEQKKEVCESVEWNGLTVYVTYPNNPESRKFTASLNESYASFLSANKITNELLLIKD